jgi:2-oxoacid dehydrogenases acyltransferase (catalytic domain)
VRPGARESAMPVLVPGSGVGIVALGRARWMWNVDRGDGIRRAKAQVLKLGISWSADHRVVEGAELATFVETWAGVCRTARTDNCGRRVEMRHFTNTKMFHRCFVTVVIPAAVVCYYKIWIAYPLFFFVGWCDFAKTPKRFQG